MENILILILILILAFTSIFCILYFCFHILYFLPHQVHVRTMFLIRVRSRVAFFHSCIFCSTSYHTKFMCERGCIYKSDHVRIVEHLTRWYLFSIFLVQCPTFLITFFTLISHKVHVRIGLNTQVRPRAVCYTPFTLLLRVHIFLTLFNSYEAHVRAGVVNTLFSIFFLPLCCRMFHIF